MPDPTLGEAGGIFAGIVALLATIGGGFKWMLGWRDRREESRAEKLAAWEARLEARDTDYQASIEKRLRALVKWAVRMQTNYSALWNGYQHLATELRHKEPGNSALARAEEMIRLAMPLDPHIPADFAEMLAQAAEDEEGGS